VTLADQIRAHLNHPGSFPGTTASKALLAVVDKCEQMRDGAEMSDIADEFEQVIARELGIES